MNWKLPSSQIVTDRQEGETEEKLFRRHNLKRYLMAERDLLKALDLLEGLRILYGKNKAQTEVVDKFLDQFIDKTLN